MLMWQNVSNDVSTDPPESEASRGNFEKMHFIKFRIHYLHKSHNTPLLPPKNLHRHYFRLLLGHFHVPGEIANNGYATVLEGNRGVLWDCASSECWKKFSALMVMK